MAVLLAVSGIVATIQGVSWLGTARTEADGAARLRRRGSVLAPVGVLVTWTSLVLAMVPGFV